VRNSIPRDDVPPGARPALQEPIRVLVADDHAPTREGVRLLLEPHGFAICAECADAPGAVAAAQRHCPDLCLLDIRMPGNGVAAAAETSASLPDTAIVMLTVSRNDDDLLDALRAGASGYLLKDTDRVAFVAALKGVLVGEAAMDARLVARLIDEFRERGRRRRRLLRQRAVALTPREWEVLDFLGEGLSTAEIADRLLISQVTVRRHVSRLLEALHVPHRDAAVRLLGQRDSKPPP
jgi:two-component system, NarL family, nitrate/nitrite response regulator NarL